MNNDNTDYPEEWDSVEEAKSKSTEFLKLNSGDKVRLRILSGPLAFQQLFLNKKGYNLSLASQLPGYDLRKQYAFEVLLLDGPMVGDHKIWATGQKLAEQLAEIRKGWGDIKKCDIVLSRTGEKLQTKWQVTPVPPSKLTPDEVKPIFSLVEKIVFTDKATLDTLPTTVEAGV